MSLSQFDDADLTLLRNRLAERERELVALREMATDAAEASALRLHAARQETAALRRALGEAHALAEAAKPEPDPATAEIPVRTAVAETTPPPSAPPPVPVAVPAATAAVPRRRTLRRIMALPVWRFVRPVARPVLWRARSFLTADTLRELAALRAAQDAMQEATRDAVREAVQEALRRISLPSTACAEASHRESRGDPSHGLGLGDTAAERWLLTVALEAARAA